MKLAIYRAGWRAERVLLDGAVPIDNNVSEREMKRVVLNRENTLFVGNPHGGDPRQSDTCRRHQVDPQLYFT